jgi:hypothetical protein
LFERCCVNQLNVEHASKTRKHWWVKFLERK